MVKETKGNVLYFDGCSTVELAKKYGTPLYVLSESDILAKCGELKEQFIDKYENVRVAYASKAFMPLAMCKLMEREGMCMDVVSGGELYTAMKAGFPPERIEFNGNNKTKEELEMALDYGIGRIIADNDCELELLEKLCREKDKKAKIIMRITPDVEGKTHDYMVTGKKDSKFGFPIDEESIFPSIERAYKSPYIELLGFHYHVGSGIFENEPYLKAMDVTLALAAEAKKRIGFDVKEINVGGGFGIQFIESEKRMPFSYYLEPIMKKAEEFARKQGIARPAVVIEPGKGIVGEGGITLYTIGSIKEIKGVRKYVAVDGGMSDNIRTALYGAVYDGVVANKMDKPKDDLVTICGKCCESGDIVIKDIKIARPESGDIFAVYSTGGYNYSMANNYNKNPKAAVVLVKDGKDKLIVKRQSYDDLLANELIPDDL